MDDAGRSRLVAAAQAVRPRAYCPYSNFQVGAALLDHDGNIYSGVNVENASYPVGVCAERSAISVAVSAGSTRFVACAVVTSAASPVSPCGMCRQALAEFGDMLIIMVGADGSSNESPLSELLPAQFDPTLLTT